MARLVCRARLHSMRIYRFKLFRLVVHISRSSFSLLFQKIGCVGGTYFTLDSDLFTPPPPDISHNARRLLRLDISRISGRRNTGAVQQMDWTL